MFQDTRIICGIMGMITHEGPSIGRLFSPNELGPGAAIDVSDHLDIVLNDAVPVKPTQERGKIHWRPGNASGSSVAVPAVLMRAEVENSYGIECFIQLTAAGRGTDHLGNISTILIDGAVALKPKDQQRRQ